MPLPTDDILQARAAYEALEARAQSAERRAAQLQALIAQLRKMPPPEVDLLALLRQRILDLEAQNLGLRKQLDQLAQLKTDLLAQNLAFAERRVQQPELRALAEGPSNTAFEVAKVLAAPGVPASRGLYGVLQDKQQLLDEHLIKTFAPARQMLVKIAEIFVNAGVWGFEYLAAAAIGLAAAELDLARLLAQKLGPNAVAAYTSAVEALAA